MKKLDYPEWEENREYVRTSILPKLQEIQRDFFGDESLTVQISASCGGCLSVSLFVREDADEPHKITATLHLAFFYTKRANYNKKKYEGILGFIKKHSA